MIVLVQLNFPTLNLAFAIIDFGEVVEFKDSLEVDCDADEPEFEYLCMVFRDGFTFINFQ